MISIIKSLSCVTILSGMAVMSVRAMLEAFMLFCSMVSKLSVPLVGLLHESKVTFLRPESAMYGQARQFMKALVSSALAKRSIFMYSSVHLEARGNYEFTSRRISGQAYL